VLNRRGGADHYTNGFGVRSLKETGINCWEVSRDKFPLTSGIRLVTLAPVVLMLLLGISDTESNMIILPCKSMTHLRMRSQKLFTAGFSVFECVYSTLTFHQHSSLIFFI
jgi:hypothetical protein